MEKKLYELKINERFANVMPPLNNRELESLKSSILEYGCINPIVVWYGTIVDGHHRYAICKENGIPFGIAEVAFEDEMEAVLWICQTHGVFPKCRKLQDKPQKYGRREKKGAKTPSDKK